MSSRVYRKYGTLANSSPPTAGVSVRTRTAGWRPRHRTALPGTGTGTGSPRRQRGCPPTEGIAAGSFFLEWSKVADDTVAILRAEAGRDPHDRAISDLIGQLATRSDDFRVRWAAHDARTHVTGVKLLHHPIVGDLDLPYESLPLAAGSSSTLVVHAPELDSADHDALILPAIWAASADPAATEVNQPRESLSDNPIQPSRARSGTPDGVAPAGSQSCDAGMPAGFKGRSV